jgi:hypothetical protein
MTHFCDHLPPPGSKKIQQDLARPDQLERFVSVEDAGALRALFAGLWGLDDLEVGVSGAE